MSKKDKLSEPSLDENPGLEHDETMPEGEQMTGAGSRVRDPNPPVGEDVTLENDPGLEHDETTDKGRQLTAEGSAEGSTEPRGEDDEPDAD